MKLTICSEAGERLVELEWHDQKTSILFATDDMRPAAERWIAQGIAEWVNGGQTQRSTASSDARFLLHLRCHLLSQFASLRIELDAVPHVGDDIIVCTHVYMGATIAETRPHWMQEHGYRLWRGVCSPCRQTADWTHEMVPDPSVQVRVGMELPPHDLVRGDQWRGWAFVDATMRRLHGPFASELEAREAFKQFRDGEACTCSGCTGGKL